MMPTASIHTATDTSHLMQGISTSFATVTKTATTTATTTATDTIVKTAYTTSTVTASAAKYTATHLRAIVPPHLLENATAAYTIVNKKDAAAEKYALKWALGVALTAGAALAWHVRKTPPPPAPPGIDRSKWLVMKHHVHVWLHKKLRSDAGLRRELEDAKRKLQEHETLRKAGADHASQTEKLSGEAQSAHDGRLQQMMDFNSVTDEATSLRRELTAGQDKAIELQQALKETTQELGRSIARVLEARRHTVESEDHSRVSEDVKADIDSLEQQLHAALQEAGKAKAEVASKEKQLKIVQKEASQAITNATSLEVRLDSANRKTFDANLELASRNKELLVARQEQDKANTFLGKLTMQLQTSEQEVKQAKAQLASKDAEIQAARKEVKKVDPQAIALNTELQAAQQEAKEATVKAFSLDEKLHDTYRDMKTAENGLAEVRELVPTVQAQLNSLDAQLQASLKDEEKARTDVSSLEKELRESRLEHIKKLEKINWQVVSLQEQIEEKDCLTAEREVNNRLQIELEYDEKHLEVQLQYRTARRNALEEEVEKLNSETKELKERLQDEAACREAIETEVEKLKSEIDTAKSPNMAAPSLKSFTTGSTQISPIATSSQNSSSLHPGGTPHSPPHLLSVAGGTIPSTPRPGDLRATPTTPLTTSTPKSDDIPDHIALTKSWNAREIELSAYLKGMKALTPKTNKRKLDDTEETPRPVKKPKSGEDSADHPIANAFSPGGGPAFKLPKQGPVGEADGSVVFDGSETPQALDANNLKTATAGVDDESSSVSSEQEAVKAEADLLGDILMDDSDHSKEKLVDTQTASSNELTPKPITDSLAIELTPATKRKFSADDGEMSPKPSQVLRTRENLGDEQTPSLDELTPKPVTDTTRPTAKISSPGDGPGVKFPAQGTVAQTNDGIVFDANEAADLKDADSSVLPEQVVGKAETDSLGDILVNHGDHSKDVAATIENETSLSAVAQPIQAQASCNRKSRLPISVPPAGPHKSSRNAGKLVVSLNERDLSRRSASPQKDDKAPAILPAKTPAKPRASRSPSKTKKIK